MKRLILAALMMSMYSQANASVLRTDIGERLKEKTDLNILDVSVADGELDVFAQDKQDLTKTWRCDVSSAVANKAGYSIGELQMVLMSQGNVVLFCDQSSDSFKANRIVVISHAK